MGVSVADGISGGIVACVQVGVPVTVAVELGVGTDVRVEVAVRERVSVGVALAVRLAVFVGKSATAVGAGAGPHAVRGNRPSQSIMPTVTNGSLLIFRLPAPWLPACASRVQCGSMRKSLRMLSLRGQHCTIRAWAHEIAPQLESKMWR